MKTKNNLIIYNNFIEPIKQLSNEDAGVLFKKLVSYHFEEKTSEDNPFVEFAFGMMKPLIDQNKETYKNICKRNAENGSKGGRPKNPNKPKKTQSVNLETQENPKKLNIKEYNIKENNISFDDWYFYYSKKVGRAAAEKSFNRLSSKEKQDALNFVKSDAFQKHMSEQIKPTGDYRPNPSTWLNQKRWQDELAGFNKEPLQNSKISVSKEDIDARFNKLRAKRANNG